MVGKEGAATDGLPAALQGKEQGSKTPQEVQANPQIADAVLKPDKRSVPPILHSLEHFANSQCGYSIYKSLASCVRYCLEPKRHNAMCY